MGAWEDGFAAGWESARLHSGPNPDVRRASMREPMRSARETSKPKRKVGKYQKVFGKKLKALKKKHPRTAASTIMKRAHRETKKAMK